MEFDAIREMLASYCACTLGKRLAQSLTPTNREDLIRHRLAQVRELLVAGDELGLPPLAGVYDIRTDIRQAIDHATLEPEALARIAETLQATAALSAWLERIGAITPSLARLSEQTTDLSGLGVQINEAIDERGEVRDYASRKLAELRRTIEQTRHLVRRVFDRALRQERVARYLQYSGTTFHNDRMVLPLKAEYRGRIQGIIHRSSDSGATLFVEPAESVELNNTIVRLGEEESKEITRVLTGLTQKVREESKTILTTLRAIAVLDLIAAKCRYAKKRSCICPFISENGVLHLHQARHPLLIELFDQEAKERGNRREVIPIDVRLGDDFDVMVITGPNTGGKTVTLKTMGMLVLMTQCGIPIPAEEGSQLPVYHRLFIDIGDEQSLQQSLSTFSSHLSNQLDILRHCGSRSLVLIDELGAGTDPDEGAAIGRALLDELLRLNAKAVVTTHLSALKAVAFTTERVDNAAVEFDPETLKPTYRLRLGEPGNSNALIVAHRLGMPHRLIHKAKGFLDHRTRALDKAIAGTLDSRRVAEAARREAQEAVLRAQREREALERQQEELREEQEAFTRWADWINGLRPGDEVYVPRLRKLARLVRLRFQQQKAVVSAGVMDLEMPLRDIQMPHTDAS